MRPTRLLASLFPVALAALLTASVAQATPVGPTPYTGVAGSPFDGISFSVFHLEDFEDGALNTPGVTASAGHSVLGPGNLTDSVDVNGSSYYVAGGGKTTITFSFDSGILGAFPTHAGLVWTDVGYLLSEPQGSGNPFTGKGDVVFRAYAPGDVLLGSIGPTELGDQCAHGEITGTPLCNASVPDPNAVDPHDEDRFFGWINGGGIARIELEMPDSDDWEMDHLQYGVNPEIIPEPASGLLLGFGLLALAWRHRP